MTLVALIFFEWPLARFFVAGDARTVEGPHAVGDQILCFLSHMAGLAIGVLWADGCFARLCQNGAHFYLGVAGGAALYLFVKHVLVARSTFAVYGFAQAGHGFVARFLVARGAILRFWFNVFIFVVALAAVQPVVFGVFVMAPLGGLQFHMVTGHARGQIVDFFGVILFEGLIQHNTVAGAAALHVLALCGVFVVAFLALNLIPVSVHLMVKNNLAAGIFQKNARWYSGCWGGDGVSHQCYQCHAAHKDNDRNVAFLQECPSLMFV